MNNKKILFLTVLSLLSTNVSFSESIESPIELDYADTHSEGLAKVGIWSGYWQYGYMTTDGIMAIATKYNWASSFRDGVAAVGMGKEKSTRKYGYIKKDGSLLYPIELDYAKDFHLGYAVIGMKSSNDIKKGLIDSNGKLILKAIYDSVEVRDEYINHGYIIVRKNGLYGLVNINSGIVTEPKYTSILFLDKYIRTSSSSPSGEKFGIISYSGNVLEPVFDWIHYSNSVNSVIAKVELNGKFGLLKDDLSYLLKPEYDEIRGFADMTMQVKKNGKYAYINADGSMLTDLEFDEISAFVKGVSYVKKNQKWGLLNIDGTYKLETKYDQVFNLDDEIQVIENGVKKLLTKDGKSRFDPSYEYMYPFASIDGAFKVKKDNKEIVLDTYGKKIFSVDFDTIGGFGDIYPSLAYITLNKKIGYLSIDGDYLVEPIYDGTYKDTKNDYFHTKINNQFGIVFSDGSSIKPAYDGPLQFNSDSEFGIARIDGKQTYIYRSGKLLTKDKFDQVSEFRDGMGRVYVNGKTRYIDSSGNLIEGTFDFGHDFNSGYALVYEEGKYRYINKEGEYAFTSLDNKGKFIYSKAFTNGLAAIMSPRGRWGYMNTGGTLLIDYKFNDAYAYSSSSKDGSKIAPVVLDGKIAFIDSNGKFVKEALIDYASGFEFIDDKSIIWIKDKAYVIDNLGNISEGISSVLDYDQIKEINSEGFIPIKVISPADRREKCGYIRLDGSWFIKPQFDHAVKFYSGYAQVFKDGKQGKVSKNGDITWK